MESLKSSIQFYRISPSCVSRKNVNVQTPTRGKPTHYRPEWWIFRDAYFKPEARVFIAVSIFMTFWWTRCYQGRWCCCHRCIQVNNARSDTIQMYVGTICISHMWCVCSLVLEIITLFIWSVCACTWIVYWHSSTELEIGTFAIKNVTDIVLL